MIQDRTSVFPKAFTELVDSTWVDKSWRRQTLMNSKEKIAYSWRIGCKPKAYTIFVLYLKMFKTDLYLQYRGQCMGSAWTLSGQYV